MPSTESTHVDRLYARLAAELSAYWTYERFRRHLQCRDEVLEDDPWTSRFEGVHARLERLGPEISEAPTEERLEVLDAVESELREIGADLLAEDSRVDASDLRRFLTRERRLDEEVLLGLLRFYLSAHRGAHWSARLVDKVDFLLSRLGEEICGPLLRRDRVRLRSSLAMLWGIAGEVDHKPGVVRALRSQVDAVREEIRELDDLDELEESHLVGRYRRLKHGMGRLLAEVSVAESVIETNAALSRAVRRLHGAAEMQIAGDFARLEAVREVHGLPEGLSLEIDSLRHEIEVYEEGRRWDDVRLETLHRLRRQLRVLRPQLEAMAPAGDGEPKGEPTPAAPVAEVAEPTAPVEKPAEPIRSVERSRRRSDLRWRLVGGLFQRLESVLEDDASLEAATAVLRDASLPFDLDRSEVEAFLRLRHGIGRETAWHRMVFTAAAVREHLEAQLDALETGGGGGRPQVARAGLDVAEEVLTELDREMREAELANDASRLEELRLLRMRLVRSYSALWLEVHGPR